MKLAAILVGVCILSAGVGSAVTLLVAKPGERGPRGLAGPRGFQGPAGEEGLPGEEAETGYLEDEILTLGEEVTALESSENNLESELFGVEEFAERLCHEFEVTMICIP
jgi:hypothetical protein